MIMLFSMVLMLTVIITYLKMLGTLTTVSCTRTFVISKPVSIFTRHFSPQRLGWVRLQTSGLFRVIDLASQK